MTIPESVTSMYEGAFSECSGLESVIIENGVKSIPGDTFRDCTSLTTVTIPASIAELSSSAFGGCTKLEFIVVDNASSDNSVEIAEGLGLKVIKHDSDRGYGGSNKSAFNYAKTRNVDIFAILHSDCQYDPSIMDKILGPALRVRREP